MSAPRTATTLETQHPTTADDRSLAKLEPVNPTTAAISETDYDAIASAVMETERGRWFLKEYARRNRNADTERVLAGLSKLEERLAQPQAPSETSTALISHNVLDLAEAITQVKREVQELGGNTETQDHFNTATSELEAIVTQTETATGEILEAAEKIQEVLWTLRELGGDDAQCDIIESKVIDIYTACSFQDLTGQRSSKVVRLVGYVEKRVTAMMNILGLTQQTESEPGVQTATAQSDHAIAPAYQEGDKRADAHLLHGPALDDPNEQTDVDALFNDVAGAQPTDASDPNTSTTSSADIFDKAQEALAQSSGLQDDLELTDFNYDDVDIFTDNDVVELHDAEILHKPAEDKLAAAMVSGDDGAQDIFDVDMLEFDGPDIADASRASDAETDEAMLDDQALEARLVISAIDEFAVDGNNADMFLDQPDEADEGPAEANLAAEQDIFDADDISMTGPEIVDDASETLLDAALEEENDSVVSDDKAALSNDTIDETDSEDEVPYTDEERIALFS